jgi:hypothetical protein
LVTRKDESRNLDDVTATIYRHEIGHLD